MLRLLPFLIVPVLLISACASPMAATDSQANERLACASLGIDPGSAQFSSCVANLAQTEFDANNVGAR